MTPAGRLEVAMQMIESGHFNGKLSGDPRRKLRDKLLGRKRSVKAARQLLGWEAS